MERTDSLFWRSHGAVAGADLMKHQSGKETVRTDERGTWRVGCPTRLPHCGIVRIPGIATPWRFFCPATGWLSTAGVGCGLRTGIEAEAPLRLTVKRTLEFLRGWRHLPPLGNAPARYRRYKPRDGRLSHLVGPC
jgi:hypothetical protein